MDIVIRRACADDWPAVADLDGASFGFQYADQELDDARTGIDLDRFYVATQADRIIGITGDYPFTMSVPGGQLAVAGVSWVSVDVTYRRRGVLRELMRRQLTDHRDAGLPAAILTASESGIYGRFGYGIASHVRKTVIDRRRVRLANPGDAGSVVRASSVEARKRMPAIHERWRAQTPGALDRTDAWWDYLGLDREYQRMGMSGLFYLLHEDGYIAYRIKNDWNDGDPRHLCWVADYVVTTAEAHAALWQVLLSMDLVGSIESFRIPMDDPLQYLVTDGRQVRTTHIGDGVWIRPLDVAAMLAARRYAVDVDVTIAVADDLFGDGCYRLTGSSDAATCTRCDARPDLVLDSATLGATYLGGVRLETMVRAGRVTVNQPGAMRRLDRALLADRLPAHGTAF